MDLFVCSSCWMLLWLKFLYRFVDFLRMFLEDLEINEWTIHIYCLIYILSLLVFLWTVVLEDNICQN